MRTVAALIVALAAQSAACAPTVDDPIAAQRGRDRDDEARLAHQLAALPTVTRAEVTLTRPAVDLLAASAPIVAPTAAILLVTEAAADRPHVATAARTLARAAVPEIAEPTILVEPGAPRPELAMVGPFSVEARSRALLRATLAITLVVIAGLAAAVAFYRRGTSAQ